MLLKTTLTYTEPLIKKAVLSFWWRLVGIKYLFAIGLVGFALSYGYSVGSRSWLMGIYATVLLFAIAFIAGLYLTHYRNSIQKFKALGNAQASFSLAQDSFTFSSDAGSATLPWSSVTEVWQFPEYWLLFFSKSQFSTLPVVNLTPEIQAFIVERINHAGGNIN